MKEKTTEFIKLFCKVFITYTIIKIIWFMFISTIVFWVKFAVDQPELMDTISIIFKAINYHLFSLIFAIICFSILFIIKTREIENAKKS